MTDRRHTLDDLASSLGLSANTVSRALRGKDGVGEATRQRVLDEAERVGYTTPRAGSTAPHLDAVALCIPSLTHPFASEVAAAIETGVRAAGCALEVFATNEDPQQEERIAQQLLDSRPGGVITIPVHAQSSCWQRVGETGTPVVTVSRELDCVECDFIGVDSEHGAYVATRHLLGDGASSILYLDEELAIGTIAARRRGFERAMDPAESRAQVRMIPTRRYENAGSQWRAQEGYRACLDALRGGDEFDAVLCGDDFFALGAMRALAENGRRVPEDVRVVGYGDLPFAEWLTPSLSSVALPVRLIGELAVANVLQRIGGSISAPSRRLIRAELVVRSSSG
ncbi:LacI family DNA-binding transcriptional regulator [Brachybacterium alimentarium]|uniref:LacI family DNA-binding transcriptional regulator n=1 Tax=Brachybacterium alimentarium TaxID=47845 RepID=UPI003FD4EB81